MLHPVEHLLAVSNFRLSFILFFGKPIISTSSEYHIRYIVFFRLVFPLKNKLFNIYFISKQTKYFFRLNYILTITIIQVENKVFLLFQHFHLIWMSVSSAWTHYHCHQAFFIKHFFSGFSYKTTVLQSHNWNNRANFSKQQYYVPVSLSCFQNVYTNRVFINSFLEKNIFLLLHTNVKQ